MSCEGDRNFGVGVVGTDRAVDDEDGTFRDATWAFNSANSLRRLWTSALLAEAVLDVDATVSVALVDVDAVVSGRYNLIFLTCNLVNPMATKSSSEASKKALPVASLASLSTVCPKPISSK